MNTNGVNYLSRNLRYLRKRKKLSQQQFADILNIKRSNIAAYETKNVEPRLALINTMAEYFGVSLSDIISVDLKERARVAEFGGNAITDTEHSQQTGMVNLRDLQEFQEQSERIRKMLDGFKVFYQYKKEINEKTQEDRLNHDVENFLIFIDHMLEYNEQVIQMLDGAGRTGTIGSAGQTSEPGSRSSLDQR
nr:helix-turn-helix transcriptional regulator [Lewinella sp. W8]